ncbi:MAG: hypothetical protein LC785_00550 [Acidobacteria bacterium]|nr:hypothetical protein [Acidobacteriota bacterium]MCA1640482.1 hypothetical protein [Acidobacteriota bacterium]
MGKEQIITLMIGIVAGLMPTIIQIVKDFYFETWKTKRAIESDFQRHKNWIVLAAVELCLILRHIVVKDTPDFFDPKLLHTQPSRPATIFPDDLYYRKYYLVVSVYRLSAFLGWLELYRQDITFLNSGEPDKRNYLDGNIEKIRNDLENDKLNRAPDREKWTDALILREEQRAIGETMILSEGGTKIVIGYGKYCDLFNPLTGGGQDYWIEKATNFFLVQESALRDFRPERIKHLIVHLVDLIELLNPERIRGNLSEWRTEYKRSLSGT